MAARTNHNADDSRHRKAVLFCQECGHESPLPGDWRTEESSGAVRYICPSCETTIVEQSGPKPITC